MNLVKRTILGALAGGSAVLLVCCDALAQPDGDASAPMRLSARAEWQQRVVRRGRPNYLGTTWSSAQEYQIAGRSSYQKTPLRTASAVPVPGIGSTVESMEFDPLAADPAYDPASPIPAEMGIFEPGCSDCVDIGGPCVGGLCGGECGGEYAPECADGCGCGGCDAAGVCDGCYGGHPITCQTGGFGHGPGLLGLRSAWWTRDLSLFAGVHGFKGPPDRGRNGNFGIHEGLNFGAPFGGPWGLGYQVGFNAVHSNFSGDQVNQYLRRADRNQVFFTAGIFRRSLGGGFQWGVAFDLLHDNYYFGDSDLKQVRTESSYLFPGGLREIGYFGAYGTGDDNLILLGRDEYTSLEPTDMFAFYYRRYFVEGGDGRLWGGFTGRGDGLLGGDIRVPIGKSWAIENRVNYLIPKQGHGAGQAEESWGLSINLVWYAGAPSRCVDKSPFRPMFNVADNTSFMSDADGFH